MIDYDNDFESGTIHCDRCSATEDIDAVDFQDLVNQSRMLGWLTTKVNDEWTHFCPDCKGN